MDPTQLYGMAVMPLVIGLTEAIKETGAVPSKFSPLVAWLVGILAGVAVEYSGQIAHPLVVHGIMAGLGIGLGAGGLYSGVQKIQTLRATNLASFGTITQTDPPGSVGLPPNDSPAWPRPTISPVPSDPAWPYPTISPPPSSPPPPPPLPQIS